MWLAQKQQILETLEVYNENNRGSLSSRILFRQVNYIMVYCNTIQSLNYIGVCSKFYIVLALYLPGTQLPLDLLNYLSRYQNLLKDQLTRYQFHTNKKYILASYSIFTAYNKYKKYFLMRLSQTQRENIKADDNEESK